MKKNNYSSFVKKQNLPTTPQQAWPVKKNPNGTYGANIRNKVEELFSTMHFRYGADRFLLRNMFWMEGIDAVREGLHFPSLAVGADLRKVDSSFIRQALKAAIEVRRGMVGRPVHERYPNIPPRMADRGVPESPYKDYDEGKPPQQHFDVPADAPPPDPLAAIPAGSWENEFLKTADPVKYGGYKWHVKLDPVFPKQQQVAMSKVPEGTIICVNSYQHTKQEVNTPPTVRQFVDAGIELYGVTVDKGHPYYRVDIWVGGLSTAERVTIHRNDFYVPELTIDQVEARLKQMAARVNSKIKPKQFDWKAALLEKYKPSPKIYDKGILKKPDIKYKHSFNGGYFSFMEEDFLGAQQPGDFLYERLTCLTHPQKEGKDFTVAFPEMWALALGYDEELVRRWTRTVNEFGFPVDVIYEGIKELDSIPPSATAAVVDNMLFVGYDQSRISSSLANSLVLDNRFHVFQVKANECGRINQVVLELLERPFAFRPGKQDFIVPARIMAAMDHGGPLTPWQMASIYLWCLSFRTFDPTIEKELVLDYTSSCATVKKVVRAMRNRGERYMYALPHLTLKNGAAPLGLESLLAMNEEHLFNNLKPYMYEQKAIKRKRAVDPEPAPGF